MYGPVNSGSGHDLLASPRFGLASTVTPAQEHLNAGVGFHSNAVRGATINIDPQSGLPADRVRALAKERGAEIGRRFQSSENLTFTLRLVGATGRSLCRKCRTPALAFRRIGASLCRCVVLSTSATACTMALVHNTAKICKMAMLLADCPCMPPKQSANYRSDQAESLVGELFRAQGWQVDFPHGNPGKDPDIRVEQGHYAYAIEVKAPAESRADRVIPLLSQAVLQAQLQARISRHSFDEVQPLAVICLSHASSTLVEQIMGFSEKYAPEVAVGIVSLDGVRRFRGPGLEGLNQEAEPIVRPRGASAPQAVNLFSDLNQWLLKVLLATDLPEGLLSAPRERYVSGAALANAADVSRMSASRFLQQLKSEGHLDDSGYLTLVRKEELFRRWRAANMRPVPEQPMRALIPLVGNLLQPLVDSLHADACLAVFAAAAELKFGHVSGVPPYIYVRKLPLPNERRWGMLTPARTGKPNVVLRQAQNPQSVFRGAVQRNGMLVSDVIQVWLDVAHHPSRGAEQAELIYQKILAPIAKSSH